MMMKSAAANVAFVGLVVLGFLATPSPSLAGPFDWLCPWHGAQSSSGQALTYAPPYSPTPSTATPAFVSYGGASACNTCATPGACGTCVSQTCAYTPQTTYRWTYSRVNRLSYRPEVGCDPCSGQRTTYYRPVQTRTLLPWLHQVPVTSYRLACCPTPCAQGSACNTCSTGFVSGGLGSSCATCVGGSTGDQWRPADPSYSSSPLPTYGNVPGPLDAEAREAEKPAAPELAPQPEPDPVIDPASVRSPGRLNAPGGPPAGPIAIRSTARQSDYRTVSYEAPASMTPFGPDARRRMEENFRRASGK